jgi:hypothetical protein
VTSAAVALVYLFTEASPARGRRDGRDSPLSRIRVKDIATLGSSRRGSYGGIGMSAFRHVVVELILDG